MNEEEAVKELEEIVSKFSGDNELIHIHADELLLKFLAENGYTELVHNYESIQSEFWYA